MPLTGKVIVNVHFATADLLSAPGNSLAAAFFIMNEAGTDVVGFYDTVFMQRGKAGGKRRRKNFCAGRQTGTVWQSEGAALRRPARSEREKRYGLKRFAFQTENAPEGMKKGNAFKRHCLKGSAFIARRISVLEDFQFEMLHISNHTACRFAETTRFFRSRWPGRRSAAASRFTFFKVETL